MRKRLFRPQIDLMCDDQCNVVFLDKHDDEYDDDDYGHEHDNDEEEVVPSPRWSHVWPLTGEQRQSLLYHLQLVIIIVNIVVSVIAILIVILIIIETFRTKTTR